MKNIALPVLSSPSTTGSGEVISQPLAEWRLPCDEFVSVDLIVATHSAVVVDVRVEFPGLDNALPSDGALVIPRGQCDGDKPHASALYREAKDLVLRLSAAMGHNAEAVARVLARVAGQPVAILG